MTGVGKGQGGTARSTGRGGRFDGFSLAAEGAAIEGDLDASKLPRVNDQLAAESGGADLHYRIAGSTGSVLNPALEISLSGSVPLICQRCLQAFDWAVEQRTLVLLARDESELARLDEDDPDHEVILADAPLDIETLVEDELLLTLPFAPLCPDDVCPALRKDDAAQAGSADRSSPFDALAAWRTGQPPKTQR